MHLAESRLAGCSNHIVDPTPKGRTFAMFDSDLIHFQRNDALEKFGVHSMVASIHKNSDIRTYLSPGQKFESAEMFGLGSEALTVARLVRDRFGFLHVTLRTGAGREISAFVEQVEMAVTEGHLVPVNPSASSIAC